MSKYQLTIRYEFDAFDTPAARQRALEMLKAIPTDGAFVYGMEKPVIKLQALVEGQPPVGVKLELDNRTA